MILHFLSIGCLVGFAVFNYDFGRKNVLYPPFLFSTIWLVVLSLYFCMYVVPIIEMKQLGAYTLFVVVSAVAAFTGGGFIVRRRRCSPVRLDTARSSVYKRILFFCALALLPLFFMQIRRLSAAGGLDGFLMSARVELIEELTKVNLHLVAL